MSVDRATGVEPIRAARGQLGAELVRAELNTPREGSLELDNSLVIGRPSSTTEGIIIGHRS